MKAIAYEGDLSGQTNLWANAITSDGSMWVWIPRFAYKITSGYTATKTHNKDNAEVTGSIDIKFVDTNNKFLDGTSGTAKTDPAEITYSNGKQNEWLVHPAFTNNPENGGWDTNLEGIWVGKFEATGTTTSLTVKAGTESLRNISINDAYKLARTSTFGENLTADELGSHMAKNSEWGAVAYLAHSKYGRDGKIISKNTSESYYTGGSNSEIIIYEVNFGQSTTGNATGVYDMNGGSWEFVASYVNWRSGLSSSSYKAKYTDDTDLLLINGGNTSDSLYGNSLNIRNNSTKYKTVYESKGNSNTESMNLSYDQNINKKGDAIYETSSGTGKVGSDNTMNSWFRELSIHPNWTHPFFKRSGYYDVNTPSSGIFYFNNDAGAANKDGSFRPVLAF